MKTVYNFVKQFPEIFERYKPTQFLLPNKQMSDFFDSSAFLFGSLETQNISMIFSAIQRLYGNNYISFKEFIEKKESKKYQTLFCLDSYEKLQNTLDNLDKDYNEKYGMRRVMCKFYCEWLNDKNKHMIIGKMVLPSNYKSKKRNTLDGNLEVRLGLLLEWRDKYSHQAKKIPFSNDKRYSTYKIDDKNELMSKLTFEEFYKITRKAMASFWLSEYKTYVKSGGKEITDKLIKRITKQVDELNKGMAT